jgi:peptidoglycan/xylan/chitin deacetylase (PgdA/CDA1 family)
VIALWHRLPVNFEEQLRVIGTRASAYHFDDGHDDVLRAADGLEGMGLRGVFFVITGRVGQPGSVSVEQLRELVERGHEVGNHTRTHPVMPRLPADRQRIEIATAQVDLAGYLGLRPRRFAWPHGEHDAISDDVAGRFGFVETRDISDVVRRIDRRSDDDLRLMFP